MTLQKKSWRVRRVVNSARKYLGRLDLKIQKAILIKIECLEFDPYQGDIRKVQGKVDIFRLRIDDYRVYYRLCPEDKSIDILLISHKSAIKERTIQRI